MRQCFILFSSLFIFLGSKSSAQIPYSFSHSSGTYAEFTGGTTLTGVVVSIPLPFTFTIGGATNDTIFILGQNIKLNYSSSSPTFVPFGADLANGTKTYEITGSPGQRILKLQYKNMNFGHDVSVADYINYQVWFMEADNSMEVRFGTSSVQNPVWSYYYDEGGPFIGFYQNDGSTTATLTLTGDPAMPVADTTTGLRLTGTPPNGMVYRFAPITTSVAFVPVFEPTIFPNPSKGGFILKTKPGMLCDVVIRNIQGQIVFTKKDIENDELIDGQLSPGLYLVEVSHNMNKHVTKLLVH